VANCLPAGVQEQPAIIRAEAGRGVRRAEIARLNMRQRAIPTIPPAWMPKPVMRRICSEDVPYHKFVNIDSKALLTGGAIRGQPNRGLRCFIR